ncbi:THO complex subunit 6 [Homalodisca vitripennis]|nr:THO complex subunit 6 [Homalodisca vitripennis]
MYNASGFLTTYAPMGWRRGVTNSHTTNHTKLPLNVMKTQPLQWIQDSLGLDAGGSGGIAVGSFRVLYLGRWYASWMNASVDSYEKPDVNAMVVSTNETTGSTLLYAGCGDKKVHVFSLEDGKCLRSMEGHEDYIHSIQKQGWQLVSAGEDGSVRLWDLRQKSLTNVITPHTHAKVERPSLGKWIGDAALSEDWLVCGGGPRLSLWHLRTMDVMASFHSVDDSGLHVTRFYEDRVLAGGTAPHLYHLSLTGDIYAQVDVSATTVFSVAIQEAPHKVMCIAGSSPDIDVCTNFSYREQVISFL